MDNLPVFGSSEVFRTWKSLKGKPSKKLLEVVQKRIESVPKVHPAILIAFMDAMNNEGAATAEVLLSAVSKSRPNDCSPAVRASEILSSHGEDGPALKILEDCRSRDEFHLSFAKSKIYHKMANREMSVEYAKRALDHDPSEEMLYLILEGDDPDGNWYDRMNVQGAYEGKESHLPADARERELFAIYKDWNRGNTDLANERLVKSQFYQKGDWEFLLASARMSVDEKDWRSAKMMYNRILDTAPAFVRYEAAEAYVAGRDPASALEMYGRMEMRSQRVLQGRIAACLQIGNDEDIMLAIREYLANEYSGSADYAECIDMLLDTGRTEMGKEIIDLLGKSNKKDPSYLVGYSKYLLYKGDLRGARKYSREAVRYGRNDAAVKVLSARIKFISDDEKSAEKECDKVLDSDPQNRGALILKKDILVKRGDVEGALKVSRAILDNDPTNISAMMTLSAALSYQGDTSSSMIMLRKVLDADPSRDNVLNVIGSMLESGMYREAMYLCYDLERTMPGDYMIRRFRGNAEYNLKDYVKASVSFAAAAEVAPHDAAIWHSKGMADEARGDLDSAEAAYDRAIVLNLKEPEYWISKAAIHEKRGDLYGAIESLNRAIELSPDTIYAMVRKAVILEGEGRYKEALYFVDLCTVTDPENPDVELLRARILRESGSIDEAISRAEVVHEAVCSENSTLELAACYMAAGRRVDAIQVVKDSLGDETPSPHLLAVLDSLEEGQEEIPVIESEPQPPQVYDQDAESLIAIAESMFAMGDLKGALRMVDQAIATGGEEPGYLYLKIRILMGMGEANEASDIATEALKDNPKSAVMHEAMGDIKMAKSEYRGALQEYEKAISLGLNIPELLMKKGDAQQGLGFYDRSIDSYSMAVTRDPDNRDIRYKLSMKLYERDYLSRSDTQLVKLLEKYPEDVDAIILLARVRKDARKDAGITQAYEMFRVCTDPSPERVEEMIEVLESAGHEEEANSLKRVDPQPPADIKVIRDAEKVLRRAYVARESPYDKDFIMTQGIDETEADDIIRYLTTYHEYGDIVPGSPEFQRMERLSNDMVMKLGWKDFTEPIPLEKLFVTGQFKDVESAKNLIAYVDKAMAVDVVRDDALKMVLDKVQGQSVYEIMRSCRVGVYQARQIQLLIGAQ